MTTHLPLPATIALLAATLFTLACQSDPVVVEKVVEAMAMSSFVTAALRQS